MSKTNSPWKEYEDQVMRSLYANTSNAQLAVLLDRSVSSIKNRSNILGIKKSEPYMLRVASETRFSRGLVPWNKGRKFPSSGRSHETQFQKGQKPHNWVPIGSERITKDGYLQRKMTDTGSSLKDFVPVHHLVWIEHTSQPVPKGHALTFKDGNKRNLDPNNLELLSRADLMRRNSVQTLPPEIKAQVHLIAGFNRRLRRIERERNSGQST